MTLIADINAHCGLDDAITDVATPVLNLHGTTDLLAEPGSRLFAAANNEFLKGSTAAVKLADGDVDWVIGFWFQVDTLANFRILVSAVPSTPSSGGFEAYVDANGRFDFNVRNSSGTAIGTNNTSNGAITSGQLHHILIYHSATNNTAGFILDNGSPVESATTGAAGPWEDYLTFGAYTGGTLFPHNGKIAQAAFGVGHTDSPATIATYLHNGGVGRLGSEITAALQTSMGIDSGEFWPLSENAGDGLGYFNGVDLTDNATVTSSTGPRFDKLIDESSNSNHGTFTGYSTNPGEMIVIDVPSALSDVSYSLLFDGSEYVTIGTVMNASLPTNQAQSWECWFKTTATNFTLMSNQDGASPFAGISMECVSGELRLQVFDNGSDGCDKTETTSGGFNDGDWHHALLTWDGVVSSADGLKLYVDGSELTMTTDYFNAMTGATSTTDLQVGSRDGTSVRPLVGSIARPRIWDSELSAANAATLAAGGDIGTPVLTLAASDAGFPVGAAVDGMPITKWGDQSDQNNNASQDTLSARPTVDSANNGVAFGTGQYLDTDNTISLTNFTVIAQVDLASEVTTVTAGKGVLAHTAAGSGGNGIAALGLGSWTGDLTNERLTFTANNGSNNYGVGKVDANISSGNRIVTVKLSGTTETVRLDGSEQSTSEAAGGTMDASTAGERWDAVSRVGAWHDGNFALEDILLTPIIIDRALNPSRISRLEEYLNAENPIG